MIKLTLREAMRDLSNVFLEKIYTSDKKLWRPEEIENVFTAAMYLLTMDYMDENKK